jgi:hypothetical protein
MLHSATSARNAAAVVAVRALLDAAAESNAATIPQ